MVLSKLALLVNKYNIEIELLDQLVLKYFDCL